MGDSTQQQMQQTQQLMPLPVPQLTSVIFSVDSSTKVARLRLNQMIKKLDPWMQSQDSLAVSSVVMPSKQLLVSLHVPLSCCPNSDVGASLLIKRNEHIFY